jgi:AraC-like DNA-binding protein
LFQITDGSLARPGSRSGDLYVVGTRTQALYKTTPEIPLALAIRFHPGTACSIVGLPANELTDRIVCLEELWGSGGRDLRQRMLSAAGVDDMLTMLCTAIQARAISAGESSSTRVVRRAVDLIVHSAASLRITQLAAALGVTPRHLRRVFMAAVGIGPKEFFRVMRFQRATRAARTEQSWARIAAEAGYYDQAHMIRDFRALAGATPSRVREERRPPLLENHTSVSTAPTRPTLLNCEEGTFLLSKTFPRPVDQIAFAGYAAHPRWQAIRARGASSRTGAPRRDARSRSRPVTTRDVTRAPGASIEVLK